MAGRKSCVVSGPPTHCVECRTPYRQSFVVGMKSQRKGPPRGLCPRCTKAEKNRKKQKGKTK